MKQELYFDCGNANWIATYCKVTMSEGGLFGKTGTHFLLDVEKGSAILSETYSIVVNQFDVLATEQCRKCPMRTYKGCAIKTGYICGFGKMVGFRDLPIDVQKRFTESEDISNVDVRAE